MAEEKQNKKRSKTSVGGSRKRQRLRAVKRGTSPSHFRVDEEEEIQYGPGFSLDIPDRERTDALFRAVSSLYYRQKTVSEDGTSVMVHADYDQLRYPTLDMLLSPLRKRSPLDEWSPREVALFEAGICRFGKNFYGIAKIIGTKQTHQVVEFYYKCFKSSVHYKLWKQNKNQCYVGSVPAEPVAAPSAEAEDTGEEDEDEKEEEDEDGDDMDEEEPDDEENEGEEQGDDSEEPEAGEDEPKDEEEEAKDEKTGEVGHPPQEPESDRGDAMTDERE